jgi:LemA protein
LKLDSCAPKNRRTVTYVEDTALGASLIITLVVIAAAVIFIMMAIGIYNNLQRKRIGAQTAWSDVDVQLKRRYDLIPNLVNSVKGYAAHEKGTLEAVITARNQAASAKTVAEHSQTEGMLTQALGKLFALAEAYPQLKADANFRQLQEELVSTENKVGFSRQHYNRSASQYNEALVVFPSNIVAGIFNFARMDFFEVTEEAQREAPKVAF